MLTSSCSRLQLQAVCILHGTELHAWPPLLLPAGMLILAGVTLFSYYKL